MRRATLVKTAACVVPLAICAASLSDVVYVDDSATGANDGTSWENAFTDLHDGLKGSASGDEIRIGQGIYKPAAADGPREASFHLPNGVIVQGGYAGVGAGNPDAVDPTIFLTMLSGDLNGNDSPPPDFANYTENSLHVITAIGIDQTTELRGLIVEHGNARLYAPGDESVAGGLLCANSNLALSDCTFRNNFAINAAGVFLNQRSSMTVVDCAFLDNRAMLNGGGAYIYSGSAYFERCRFADNVLGTSSTGYGAGILSFEPVTVVDCEFTDNQGFGGGGGIAGPASIAGCVFEGNYGEDGGAIIGSTSAVNCRFIGNFCGFEGGAAKSVGALVNCVFLKNHGGVDQGGGAVSGVDLAVNCLFSGNASSYNGGAIVINGGTLINCTIVGNDASGSFARQSRGGAIYKSGNETCHLVNCIIWDNLDSFGNSQSSQIYVAGGALQIDNSCVMGWDGGLGGTGNFGDDPQLVDADGEDDVYGTEDDDARLGDGSPCRDAGDSASLPADEFDLDGDGDTSETIPLDLDFMQRVVSDGVDLGAYEHQGSACPADVFPAVPQAGDGQVNVLDLLAVIGAWGATGANPADINGDQIVNVLDLLEIIGAWGPCG